VFFIVDILLEIYGCVGHVSDFDSVDGLRDILTVELTDVSL
jgi:hypothetical protein